MIDKCPGSEKRFIQPQEINCPYCGERHEIFSDETQVWCNRCKRFICREEGKIPECFDWCPYADKCRFGKI